MPEKWNARFSPKQGDIPVLRIDVIPRLRRWLWTHLQSHYPSLPARLRHREWVRACGSRNDQPSCPSDSFGGIWAWEHMYSFLEACPNATFTCWSLVSRCWRSAGRVSLADGGMHRCELQHQGLTKACNASLKDALFDLVICYNVLHLFNGD